MTGQLVEILLTHIRVILDRFERDPAYGFVDTKFSTLDGGDFPVEDPIRGRMAVYGWIQARALEALAEHGRWLERSSPEAIPDRDSLLLRLHDGLPHLVEHILRVHEKVDKHLPFVFRPDGVPLGISPEGSLRPVPPPEASTYGDLFLAKGLISAGSFLRQPELRNRGLSLLARVLADIEAGRFRSDQQPLRPPYRSAWTSVHQEEGPWMLSLGGLDLAFRETGDTQWLNKAASFIERVVGRHVNRGQFRGLQPLDFVETTAPDGSPLVRFGRVLCVPGHALEFVGLSAKIVLTSREAAQLSPETRKVFGRTAELLPRLFLHVFELGYRAEPEGIVSSVDLLTREPIDTHLPWWAVTETLRAAALVQRLATDSAEAEQIRAVQIRLLNAILNRWVNPKAHWWLFQTRDMSGRPVDVIPATPDADPAYHTGLSLLDFLDTQLSEETK